MGNVLEDEDGVGNGDDVVVATDDERRGLDGVELGKRDVRLLPVEEEKLAVVLFLGGGVGLVKPGVVFLLSRRPRGRAGRHRPWARGWRRWKRGASPFQDGGWRAEAR